MKFNAQKHASFVFTALPCIPKPDIIMYWKSEKDFFIIDQYYIYYSYIKKFSKNDEEMSMKWCLPMSFLDSFRVLLIINNITLTVRNKIQIIPRILSFVSQFINTSMF